MEYSTFIFDFDFTLADATDGIVESVNFALKKLKIPTKERDEIRRTVGMTLVDTFYKLTGVNDVGIAKQFTGYFKDRADLVMTSNTALFPDCIITLKKLKARGIKTGIVTSKNHYRIDEALEKHNATNLIDVIIGFEDVEQAKPSPEGLLKAIDILRISKDDVIYVGDSLIDAQTAKNAEVDFAAVTTGTTLDCEFELYPHISVSSNLSELLIKLESK